MFATLYTAMIVSEVQVLTLMFIWVIVFFYQLEKYNPPLKN